MNVNSRPGFNRLLYTIGIGSLTVVAIAIGVKLFQDWQTRQANLKAFEHLKTLSTQADPEACLQAAKEIATTSSFYAESQTIADQCTLSFGKALAAKGEMRSALSLLLAVKDSAATYKEARQLVDRLSAQVIEKAQGQILDGKIEEAIVTLAAIPLDAPANATAQNLRESWRKEWKDNQAAIAEAKKALENKEWSQAKEVLGKVSSTPYWRSQTDPLKKEAEKGIEAAIVYEQQQREQAAHAAQKAEKTKPEDEFTQQLQSLYDTYVKKGMDEVSAWTTACKTVGGTVDDSGPEAICKPKAP